MKMASVLIILGIPTQAEEKRQRMEYFTKHSDTQHKKSTTKIDCTTINDSVEITTPKTVVLSKSKTDFITCPKRLKLDSINKTITLDLPNINTANDSIPNVNNEVDTPILRKSWEGFCDILTSSKKKKKYDSLELNLPDNAWMEVIIKEILKTFKIPNAVWTKNMDDNMYQILFTIELDETCEKILTQFHEWGIGDREGSTISVVNCIVSKSHNPTKNSESNEQFNETNNINAQKQGAWDKFMNSVRSRLNVAQIVCDVRQDATITFDFVVLLISAAILASFGLFENSYIFLTSSMLISPLMGPIIAGIFGTAIKDSTLCMLGLKNELWGIFIAIWVGFFFGMIVGITDDRFATGVGLTEEMVIRCQMRSLIVGILIAIPSGAAAAVGILGGNIGSLVGVAISASLLPPAVNTGLLWALSLIFKYFENSETHNFNIVKTTTYSNHQSTELLILGIISMCLTISNIICVYAMGVLVLKVKEIAPIISSNNREFWKHDIKIAREMKNGFDASQMLMGDFANLPNFGIDCKLLRSMQESAYQNTWSPLTSRNPLDSTTRENYSTIHQIERLYSTITLKENIKTKFGLPRKMNNRGVETGVTYNTLNENVGTNLISLPSISNCTLNSTPKANQERKKRKFIVTPAVEPLSQRDDDVDV